MLATKRKGWLGEVRVSHEKEGLTTRRKGSLGPRRKNAKVGDGRISYEEERLDRRRKGWIGEGRVR